MDNLVDSADQRIANGFNKILNGPNTPPAFIFVKGSIVHRDDPDNPAKTLDFQFNPESISDDRNVKYHETNPIQSEIPIYQHICAGDRTIKFKLFLNGMEHPSGRSTSAASTAPFDNKFGALSRPIQKGIDGAVSWGLSRVPFAEGIGEGLGILSQIFTADPSPQPTQQNRDVLEDMKKLDDMFHGTGNKPPPVLLFDWRGYRDSAWILTDLKFETSMWDKNQFPLHVHADITMKEVDRSRFSTRFKTNNVFFDDFFSPSV